MQDTTQLTILFVGYMNEEWPERYGTIWASLSAYLLVASNSDVWDLVNEAEQLQNGRSEAELERALLALGLNYMPTADGFTYHKFVCGLLTRARQHLQVDRGKSELVP